MNCAQVRDNFSALIDGDVGAADRQAAEAHLSGCVGCRQELDVWRRTVGGLSTLGEAPVPAGIPEQVMARVRAEAWWHRLATVAFRPWRVKLSLEALAVAATAVIVVAVSRQVVRQSTGGPRSRQQMAAVRGELGIADVRKQDKLVFNGGAVSRGGAAKPSSPVLQKRAAAGSAREDFKRPNQPSEAGETLRSTQAVHDHGALGEYDSVKEMQAPAAAPVAPENEEGPAAPEQVRVDARLVWSVADPVVAARLLERGPDAFNASITPLGANLWQVVIPEEAWMAFAEWLSPAGSLSIERPLTGLSQSEVQPTESAARPATPPDASEAWMASGHEQGRLLTLRLEIVPAAVPPAE